VEVGGEVKATQGGAKKQNKRRDQGAIGQKGTEVAEVKERAGGGGGGKLNP